MNKLAFKCIFAFMFLCSSVSLFAYGKITIDPNAPGVQKETSAQTSDPRLLQKVTYDSGYKRLNVVASDLTKLTGVSIVSGNGRNDWRVRDIPVVVCVKDMPLGKLLRAIADATHTRVALDRIGNDPEKCYRIYRRYKEEKEIDTLLQKEHDAYYEKAKWQWDALAAYGKSDKDIPGVSKQTKLIAKLIASLGNDAKNKLLNYDTLKINGNNPSTHNITDNLYMLQFNEECNAVDENGKRIWDESYDPTRDDMDNVTFSTKLQDDGSYVNLNFEFAPVTIAKDRMFMRSISVDDTKNLIDSGLNLPPCPADFDTPEPKDDMKNSDMTYLDRYNDGWSRPILNQKIDLAKPVGRNDRTLADLARAIQNATGMNVVMEDFFSQNISSDKKIDDVLYKNTTISEALRYTDFCNDWFIDEKNKLLVGWVYDWRLHHRDLVSEDYISSLKTKLNGEGLQLEDIIHMGCLSSGAYNDWFQESKDFPSLSYSGNTNTPLWQLYDSLDSQYKQQAKSKDGLPLAKLDISFVSSVLSEQKKRYIAPTEFTKTSDEERQKIDAENDKKLKAFSDPSIISTMVMRVEQKQSVNQRTVLKNKDGNVEITSKQIPSDLKLYQYSISVDYNIDGENYKINEDGPEYAFPLYSPEREDEILKAQNNGSSK